MAIAISNYAHGSRGVFNLFPFKFLRETEWAKMLKTILGVALLLVVVSASLEDVRIACRLTN